jgi:hypothetical protein
MADKTNNTQKRLSQSQRKHIRRLKQDARKTGVPYTVIRPVVVKPTVAQK